MGKTNAFSRNNWLTTSGMVDYNDARLDQYVLQTSDVTFNSIGVTTGISVGGDVTIGGNLTVSGNTTIIDTQQTTILDNIIVINSGQATPGVTGNLSGIEVYRGGLTSYQSVFQESTETFRIGQVGATQAVATREDVPLNYGIMIYNPTGFILNSVNNITIPITYSSGTASTTSSTGSLKVQGGVGITGDVCIDGKFRPYGTDYTNYLSSDTSNNLVLNSSNDILLTVTSGKAIQIPSAVNLTFGNNGVYVIGNGNNITVNSSLGTITLNTFSSVNIPVNTPLQWNTGNYIYSDSLHLYLTTTTGKVFVSSVAQFTNSTSSSSSSIGSIVCTGGFSSFNTTNANNSSSGGGMTLDGGAAIAKSVYIGESLNIGDIAATGVQTAGQGVSFRSRSRTFTSTSGNDLAINSFEGGVISTTNTITNANTVYISGSPTITGGGSITNSYSLNINSGNMRMTGQFISTNSNATSNSTSGGVLLSGAIAINNGTNAASVSSGGTFFTAGGIAITKDVYIGGKLDLGNVAQTLTQVAGQGINFRSKNNTLTTASNNDTTFNSFEGGNIVSATSFNNVSTVYITGSPTITGGGSITNSYALMVNSGDSVFGGKITVADSTASTSSTVGAITLTGGISISNTTDSSSYTNGGTITTAGGISVAKTGYFGNKILTNNGIGNHHQLQNGGVDRFVMNLSNSESGGNTGSDFYIKRYSDLGVLIDNVFTIARTDGIATFSSTVISSSATTAALNLNGGIGINCTTNALSNIYGGSLTSKGGASFEKDIYIGGATFITGNETVYGVTNLNQTNISTTNGALAITGSNGITATIGAASNLTTTAGSITLNSQANLLSLQGYSGVNMTSTNGNISINGIGNSNFSTTGALTVSGVGLTIAGNTGNVALSNSSLMSFISGSGGVTINTTDSVNGIKIGNQNASNIFLGNGATTITLDGDTLVTGNLIVTGATTTIDSTIITISDIAIVVNDSPTGTSDGGFLIHRWQDPNDSLLGDLINGIVKETSTFQSGSATPGTLVLNATASSTTDYYKGWWISITSGAGANQVRRIKSYNGGTRTATLYVTADNTPITPGPLFTDGLNLTTAPSSGDTYKLFDSPYAGVYFDATNQEIRVTGVSFDPHVGVFGTPTTYLNLHCNTVITETGFVANGSSAVQGSFTVTGTAVDNVIFRQATSLNNVVTVDTVNGKFYMCNPVSGISTSVSSYLCQYDSLGNQYNYSGLTSTIIGNIAASLSSKFCISVQNGSGSLTNFLELNGNTGVSDFTSSTSVRILNTSSSALTVSGGTNFNDTTESSNVGTGSVILLGGMSVAKKISIGDYIKLSATNKINNTTSIAGTEGNINTNGDIVLYNSSSQAIVFSGNGSGTPTVSTRSLGTKLILNPTLNTSTTDTGLGVSTAGLWLSVADTTKNTSFYLGNTEYIRIDSTGLSTKVAGTGIKLHNGVNIYESSGTTRLVPYDSNPTKGLVFRDSSDSSDRIGINSDGQLIVGLAGYTGTPSTIGNFLIVNGVSFTDNFTSASGISTNMNFNSFGQGTLNASNTSVTTETVANIYIEGAPIRGTNQTVNNSYGLFIDNVSSLNTTGTGASLYVNGAPSGATNAYSILVNSGVSRFGGKVNITTSDTVGSTNTLTGTNGGLNVNGDITLYNATSQVIIFSPNGSATPGFTTRSLGTKLVLKGSISGSTVDSAIGISSDSMWYSVPDSTFSHKLYFGTTALSTFDSTGLLCNLTDYQIRTTSTSQKITLGTTGNSQIIINGNAVNSGNLTLTSVNGTINLSTTLADALLVNNNGTVRLNSTDNDNALKLVGGATIDKNLTVSTQLNLNFNQMYTYTGEASGALIITSGTSGIASNEKRFTLDSDNTDDNLISFYGTALEYMKIGYNSAGTNYLISTQKTSSGTVRSISLETGTNSDQIKLLTDGTVSFSSTTSSSSATVGAVKFNGGVSINCSTNSSSNTNGGSLTTPGGAAIAKDVYIGGNTVITGDFSAGISSPTLTVSNSVNISTSVSVQNVKSIKNGNEVTLSAIFRMDPDTGNTLTSFQFTIPGMITDFANIYDIILTSNGYYNDATPINLENISGFAVTGTKKATIQFTSGTTLVTNTLMVIIRYTIY